MLALTIDNEMDEVVIKVGNQFIQLAIIRHTMHKTRIAFQADRSVVIDRRSVAEHRHGNSLPPPLNLTKDI